MVGWETDRGAWQCISCKQGQGWLVELDWLVGQGSTYTPTHATTTHPQLSRQQMGEERQGRRVHLARIFTFLLWKDMHTHKHTHTPSINAWHSGPPFCVVVFLCWCSLFFFFGLFVCWLVRSLVKGKEMSTPQNRWKGLDWFGSFCAFCARFHKGVLSFAFLRQTAWRKNKEEKRREGCQSWTEQPQEQSLISRHSFPFVRPCFLIWTQRKHEHTTTVIPQLHTCTQHLFVSHPIFSLTLRFCVEFIWQCRYALDLNVIDQSWLFGWYCVGQWVGKDRLV